MYARNYSLLPAGRSDIPAEVLAVTEPGPALVVRATEGDRTTHFIVASPARREVEVFHVADPGLGYPDGYVVAATRFRDVDGRAFQDRCRQSPDENSDPAERIYFCETILYREPNTVVFQTEYTRGTVQEDIDPNVDLASRYMPWPAPGDWEPFVTFPI